MNAKLEKSTIMNINEIDDIDSVPEEVRNEVLNLIEQTKILRQRPFSKPIASFQKSLLIPTVTKSSKPKLKPTHLSTLKVMFTNADQMTPSKMDELKKKMELEKPLIVAVSEMKYKNSTESTSMDYNVPGFTIHPVNLDNKVGRGLAVYTKDILDKTVIQIKADILFEEVCLLEIQLRGGDILMFACAYRSPTPNTSSERNNENLNKLLKMISTKKYSHICIVGDLNFKHINWKTCNTTKGEDSIESKFLEAVRDSFLHQHIEKPTRKRGNDDPSLLDVILTNESMQVSNITHLAPLGKK